MTLPAELLQRLPAQLQKNGVLRMASNPLGLAKGPAPAPHVNWEERICRGDILKGGVVELSSAGGAALGTSIGLRACWRVHEEARALASALPWCAFVDPTGSLYAPGVRASGVELSRLLVVRPHEENIARVVLRLVESKVFPVVVVDLMGLPGNEITPALGAWVRVVRRLSLSLEGSGHSVLLLTNKNARRPFPLPVAERLLLSRSSPEELSIEVSKSVRGGLVRHAHIRFPRSLKEPGEARAS